MFTGPLEADGTVGPVPTRSVGRAGWIELSRYLAEKGRICIDGVSLTGNGIEAGGFHVGNVPHTLEATRLGALRPGDGVSLEVHILAEYVGRRLGARSGGGDLPLLGAAGFTWE